MTPDSIEPTRHDKAREISNNALVDPRRRRLLTGTAAGAGVFLSVQAKTALGAAICQSPSVMVSGNQSTHPADNTNCWGGRSPGFWKQPGNFGNWRGVTPPTFFSSAHITDCNGLKNVSPCDLETRGTLLTEIFSGAPANFGVWEVLVWPTNYPTSTGVLTAACTTSGSSDVFAGKGQLLRALFCAYLNAGAQSSYPITRTQIIAMWDAVKGGGVYYPNGNSAAGLTADGILNYIEGMYDLGSDNLVGCKKNA